MKIVLDFDGSVANWPRGHEVDYDDLEGSMLNALAYPVMLLWMRTRIRRGDHVMILTGRGDGHRRYIEQWFRCTLGRRVQVYTRPNSVGLACAEQAKWKASVLQALAPSMYVGDNPRIDELAARQAGVAFVDAREIQGGSLPTPTRRQAGPGSPSSSPANEGQNVVLQ